MATKKTKNGNAITRKEITFQTRCMARGLSVQVGRWDDPETVCITYKDDTDLICDYTPPCCDNDSHSCVNMYNHGECSVCETQRYVDVGSSIEQIDAMIAALREAKKYVTKQTHPDNDYATGRKKL